MQTAHVSTSNRPAATRSGRWATAGVVAAGLTAAMVLVMAVLAGQAWFGGQMGLIALHGTLGGFALLGALASTVIAFVNRKRSAGGWAPLALSAVLFVLMFGQTALGMSGRSSAAAASLHIPNGVLVAMVAAVVFALTVLTRRTGKA